MSTSFDQMKKTSNKCDDLNVKMKTDGKLMCGCGGDNEFDYDPNLFDCRLFGLFLRKAENSHEKFRPILSKLNLLETAIFENKETGDSSVIEQKVNNIINEFSDINLNNQKRDFIVKYMIDKTKRKEDYNRYQLMSTLQSALNYIEVARNPQMTQLLTIVSNWVSKSDKILKGVSVSQQEVNQELVLTPEKAGEEIQAKAKANVQKADTRDAGKLALQQEKPKEPYSDNNKFQADKTKVDRIMMLLNTLNKAMPNYFDLLVNKLNDYQTKFEALKDEFVYKKHFRDILYKRENERLLFDIFKTFNDKMSIILPSRTSEESKKTQKSLTTIFNNYSSSISTYSSSIQPRDRFISDLYTFILFSKELENKPEFKTLLDNPSNNSMKVKRIITDNLKQLLKDQNRGYSNKEKFKLQQEVTPELNAITKSIKDTGKFEENSDLITSLIEGINNKEKYINFDYDEPKNSSSSSSF